MYYIVVFNEYLPAVSLDLALNHHLRQLMQREEITEVAASSKMKELQSLQIIIHKVGLVSYFLYQASSNIACDLRLLVSRRIKIKYRKFHIRLSVFESL